MSKIIPTPWERIEQVMQEHGIRKMSDLARRIGMTRAETISQIKKGKINISLPLAARIAEAFPGVDEGFLLTGKRSPGAAQQIPYYINDPVVRYRKNAPPDNYLAMPYSGVRPISFATVNNEPEPIKGALVNSVVIVEEISGDELIEDRPYLIETAEALIIRFIGQDPDKSRYRAYSDNNSKKPFIIRASDIRSLFALRYILNIY